MRSRDLEELSKEELINLVKLYSKDPLTGLKMRRDFELQYEALFETGEDFYLTMIDINGLHNINKLQGYDAGDNLIRKVVEYLKYHCQGSGDIFRLGGDEFVILSKKIHKECLETKNFCISTVVRKDFNNSGAMFTRVDELVIQSKADFYKSNGNNRRV